MRLHVVFQGSVPKDETPDASNDDFFESDEVRQRFAIADGASESYDSARWSRILTRAWLTGATAISRAGLASAIREYDAASNVAELSWSQQGAFDRGSFATLLGVELRGRRARIVALGDSIVVGFPVDGEIKSFPYTLPHEFDQRPVLLATKTAANDSLLVRTAVRTALTSWPLVNGTTLLLMTDALGQWLLKREADFESRGRLCGLNSVDELLSFVLEQRATGAMRRDDTTLVHLRAEEP